MTDTINLVRLVVNGKEYGGWKSVRIEAGIERQARSFELGVTSKWPGQTDIPRRIQPFDACQVFIGNDLVVTGHVDATPIKYDARTVTVGVNGRSKTADLVDCCPPPGGEAITVSTGGEWKDVVGLHGHPTENVVTPPARTSNQWRNQRVEVIASALAAPYNVRVIAEVDTGQVIPDHQVQPGETVFESIDRMLRLRNLLSTDNAFGDLVLIDVGSAGKAVTALVLGKNVLASNASLDYRGVFSDYIVKGQRSGSDDEFGEIISESEATAISDVRSKRRRVLVILQSGQADVGTCRDRAEYERAYRAAKALETSYTVVGWRQGDGSLWQPNQTIRVIDEIVGFDDDMLVAEVAYVLDENGMKTEIVVGPPDGYRPRAGTLKRHKSQKGGGFEWSDVE